MFEPSISLIKQVVIPWQGERCADSALGSAASLLNARVPVAEQQQRAVSRRRTEGLPSKRLLDSDEPVRHTPVPSPDQFRLRCLASHRFSS
jgi:hypothetical protein